jgi:hypothetical protein
MPRRRLHRLLRWNAERASAVVMATFTMSHHKGQRLKTLWDGLGWLAPGGT